MKIYLVGGAVRDRLLNQPVKEKDWVVVGATVADMLERGYRQVGKEFPVFIHPKTGEEYALARMERKVGPGYKGFTFDASPHVSLEDDLLRRDLTINAIAESADGEFIDPYHGREDLKQKVLRHVSPAFAEDPVRILRVGRFLARYHHLGFQIAPETMTLMSDMVNAGEVDALVAERVWKELERALGEKNPAQFFNVLARSSALPKLFPNTAMQDDGMQALITSTQLTTDTSVRFAALVHQYDKKEITALCKRYRLPNHYRQLANLTATHYSNALKATTLPAAELVQLFGALDIYRRNERFQAFLLACESIAMAQKETFDPAWLATCADIARGYDVQELVKQGLDGNELALKLKEMRIKCIKNWLEQ